MMFQEAFFSGPESGCCGQIIIFFIPNVSRSVMTFVLRPVRAAITAVTDHYDSVPESNESNNFKKVTLSVVSLATDPDLIAIGEAPEPLFFYNEEDEGLDGTWTSRARPAPWSTC